jgi:hypothetical protein
MLISLETKGKFLKKDDRIELKSSICGYIETFNEYCRNLWNKIRELEKENLKLYKILYFINIYPIEIDIIDENILELALQNDNQITTNTFTSLQSIQSNYQWFSFIMDRPPNDINELKEFMREQGQAPKYYEVKDKLSNILKTIKA